VENLDNYDTVTRVLTDDTEFGDTFLIEVSRGCSHRCKFCMTAFAYGRFRTRSLSKILGAAETGLKYTDRIGLVGAAVSDYPEIDELCIELRRRGAKISTSSLRADSLTPVLVKSLAESGRRTITIAPEAGTQRLRDYVNKGVSEEDIFNSLNLAKEYGIKRARLYFMIGLPTETTADIDSMIEMIKQASEILPVRASISVFVPKPGTPFAGEPMEEKKSVESKVWYIKRMLGGAKGIRVSFESVRQAFLEWKLACGGTDAMNDYLEGKWKR
jgi:radical SAM superfamily enzyme YgiQ (UPF0313 family)